MNIRLVKAIIISGLGMVISYIISFTLTPYITRTVGVDAYGYVTLAKTFVSYAEIITISLTAFMVRYISIAYHRKDVKDARSYYSSSVAACLLCSAFLLILAGGVLWKLEHIINLSTDLALSVRILFLLIFVNFIFNTLSTPFSSAAYIENRIDISGLIKIIAYIVEAVVLLSLFINYQPQIWFVGLGSLAAGSVTLMSNYLMERKLTPNLYWDKTLVSFSKTCNLVKNGVWSSINQLGNVLNSGLDLLVANLMLSAVETGTISIVKTIGMMFAGILNVVYVPLQPQLIKSYATNDMDYFLEELKKAMKICGFIGAMAFSGFLAIGEVYYKLWLPDQNSYILYTLTLLTVINYITDSVLRPVYYVNTLSVKNKIPCVVTIVGGIANILGMYILLKFSNFGMYAIVIPTAVIMISINLIFNPIYAAKCLKISPKHLYGAMARHIAASVIMSIALFGVGRLLTPKTWISLILIALFMILIGIIIYCAVALNRREIKRLSVACKNKLKATLT